MLLVGLEQWTMAEIGIAELGESKQLARFEKQLTICSLCHD